MSKSALGVPAIKWPHSAWEPPSVLLSDSLKVTVTEVPVTPIDPSRSEGIGSVIAARARPVQVFWSRPYSRSWTNVHWARYDVASRTFDTSEPGAGLRGDLVDWLAQDERHGWFLLTHGLQRVDLDSMKPVEILSKGFPKWMYKLLPLGPALLGVTGWSGATITVVETSRLSVVGLVRMPSPDAIWRREADGDVELLSFNGEVARTLDSKRLRLGARRPLPKGKGPYVRGDRAWIVSGRPRVDPRAPGIRTIDGDRVSEVYLPTGEITRDSPTLPQPERVRGIDRFGRVLVACHHGFVLLDPDTLAPSMELRHDWGRFGDIALLPNGVSAAALANAVGPERLLLVEWETVKRSST